MVEGASSGASRRVVVLDDDPTGTQAATDVTVLLQHDTAAIEDALRRERSVYVQTNSRSLSEADAVDLATSIRASVDEAGKALGVDVKVVLRGDSTLRGHVFAESRVFLRDDAVMVFVPAFPDGGRITRDGIHFVRNGHDSLPVADTEFAQDPVFGFRSSDLSDFTAERTGEPAIRVPREHLLAGTMIDVLLGAPAGAVIVPDAIDAADIRAIAASIERVWGERHIVVRCAAPLAAELAHVPSTAYLPPSVVARSGGVLVVCGSHTDLAREQLARLVEMIGEPTVIDTARALVDPVGEGERVAISEAGRARRGGVRFVTTERDRSHEHATLADGAAVMTALTVAAARLAPEARVVITKGGITAADVIRRSLGVVSARVLGQVEPGVSVWDARMPGGHDVRCVIVPGNMGGPTVLADAVQWALAGSASAQRPA